MRQRPGEQDVTAPPAASPTGGQPTVVLAGQLSSEADFSGVAEAIGWRGLRVVRMSEIDAAAAEEVAAVVVRDLESPLCRYALRRAAAWKARTMLLMDGLVEWRNTFINPRAAEGFLRPAPVEVIACAGDRDREILEALGNRAVATGLPRLDGPAACSLNPASRDASAPVLIATARTPAFTLHERGRLLAALSKLRDALRVRGVPATWRLTGGLDALLGVPNDTGPLARSLARCRAVLTTPSTLLVEAMLAGRPVGVIHPHAAPLWPLTPVAWRDGYELDGGLEHASLDAEQAGTRPTTLDGLLQAMLRPSQDLARLQQRCLEGLHAPASPASRRAAEALAEAVASLIDSPRPARRPPSPPTLARPAEALPAPAQERPRAVLMVSCDATPIGGVMSWALRLAREFARDRSLGYDVRVLAVLTDPAAEWPVACEEPFNLNPDGLTSICRIDPYDDRHTIVETVATSLEALRPKIVLPGFHDVCWMAAMQARSRGARTVAVAHSDEPYYANLMRFYDRWEAGVAVSSRCREWMEPLLAGRPCDTIPYSVPVAPAPRTPGTNAGAPLQLAYIGRMVRMQKRIFDLLEVIDGLEQRGVPFHFHMVGDGADLPEWLARLHERRLTRGRVTLHGRRDMEWVQRFLPSIDASVLVSDFEGTSITMLEAMGQAVVPVVTRIASGVADWIADGRNGVTVPIGAPDEMAARLAELHADRALLARLGRAAWERIAADLSPQRIARAWADLFARTLAAPFDASPTDLGLRSIENWRWTKQWADDPAGARAYCRRVLAAAGYRNIADDAPTAACDAVVTRSCAGAPSEEQVASWRRRGLGVARAPLLMLNPAERVRALLEQAVAAGCRRIVFYGIGRHTRRMPILFRPEAGLPIVGFTDDHPPRQASSALYDLPIVPFDEVEARLRPDAVLLSTDTFEAQMWRRCAPLRRRGVRIITVYTDFETEEQTLPEPAPRPAVSAA